MNPKRLIGLSLVLLICLALVPLAQAATIQVDINDAGCNDTTGAPYCHIQPAIDAATSGDTINVAAGTYVEDLTIAKSLTLTGAKFDTAVDSRTAADSSESIIQGHITIQASNVEINGFTLTNPGQKRAVLVDNAPVPSDITIAYNMIDTVGSNAYGDNVQAIYVEQGADNVTIDGNHFNNIGSGPSKSADAILVGDTLSTDASDGLLIQNNVFTNIVTGRGAYGILLNNGSGIPNAQILNNTFDSLTGTWTHAVGLEGNTPNAVVSGNTFSNLATNPATGVDKVAIFFEDNPSGNTVTITENLFNGSDFAGVALHPDDLPGGAHGLNYTAVADRNWWGDATGPQHASNPHGINGSGAFVGDNITFTPWYATDATTAASENVTVTHNPVIAVSDTIQGAIDAAVAGDTVTVNAGTFNENILVDKHLKIIGAGSTPAGTIITQNPTGSGDNKIGVIQLAASGQSAIDPILLQDLRIEPDHLAGVSVGRFTEATGTAVQYVKLDNVHVIGTNTNPSSEQERGLYVDLTSTLQHLVIVDSAFDNLTYGWYLQKQVSSDTSTVSDVQVSGTSFSGNNLKGLYAEKLSDASFTTITVDGNGFSDIGVPSYFLPWMTGIDVNLKAGSYQNLAFEDCTITNNALGGAQNGVGLTVKARDDGGTYGAYPATLDNVLVDGCTVTGNESGIRFGEPGKGNAGPTTVQVTDSCIYDNVAAYSGNIGATRGLINESTPETLAESNFWGDATGPFHPTLNTAGLGDKVSDNVSFDNWLDSCGGTAVGNFHNTTADTYHSTMQFAIDNASPGDVIEPVGMGPFGAEGTAVVNTPDLTINLNGATFGPGSPFLTVAAANTTVNGPGVLDGAGSTSPAVLVTAGGNNFTLDGVYVEHWEDGVQVDSSVTSFKLVNNFIHDNTDAGLQVDNGVALGGVVTIEGNLFKDNGGPGVRNSSATNLPAQYNSWGDVDGPSAGDGVVGPVDEAPWTFAEIYLDVTPASVNENGQVEVAVEAEAEKLYGVTFQFDYDTDLLTLNGAPTFDPYWSGKCLPVTAPAGTIAYRCNQFSGAEWDGGNIATFTFTADLPNIGAMDTGPWDAVFDVSHLETDTSAGAIGGVKVFVNNAGFNDASIMPDRDITDANDGEVEITGTANYDGFIDLQGRANDSGATIQVFDASLISGSTPYAEGTSDAGGAYTTSFLAPYYLTQNVTYWFQVDAPLYLPTTAVQIVPGSGGSLPTDYASSHLLEDRPLTTLNTVVLLGGDATDNNLVDVLDATCIGDSYEAAISNCGGPTSYASSDVNGDGAVNILDLVLMGGNYDLVASPWTP